MKEDPIKSFRNAFQGFLKEENLEHTYKQKQVIADWERIMGKTIASRTTKMFFNQKTLFVKLSSAPLKNEMQNSKAQIIDLIEKEIGKGEVEDVRFLWKRMFSFLFCLTIKYNCFFNPLQFMWSLRQHVKSILLVCLFLCFSQVMGQDHFNDGYIIVSGQKINGKIAIQAGEEFAICVFK